MILSIDFGTSSLKLALFDRELRQQFSAKEEYAYTILPGEKVELGTDDLLRALESACARMSAAQKKSVELICYDTFSPSLTLMDAGGRALCPVVTHLDRRSRGQSAQVCEVMGKERYQSIAGVYPFTGGISLLPLLWFKQNQPELCGKIRKIGHLTTFIHYFLTGEWAVDLVNASMLGIYDTVGQTGWSDEIIGIFNINQDWLPPIVTPGQRLGTLRADTAQRLGLRAGVPVAMGTNDAMASQVGVGNQFSGQALNIAGSSDMISILTDTPALHPGYYLRNAARPGLWQIYATTSGGFAVDWFRGQFCREMDDKTFFCDYLPACVARWRDCPVEFVPYLSEDRQSLDLRRAAWRGLSLASTRDDMLTALLVSVQRVLKQTIDQAAGQIALNGVIKVTGGFADAAILALKREIFEGYEWQLREDGTVRGNAALALEYEG